MSRNSKTNRFRVNPLIRLSSAKTAYGLVRDVQRAILEEPKRVNMGTYTCPVGPGSDYNHPRPACGTVGCFAGWISILAGQGMVTDDVPARKLLGEHLDYTFTSKSGCLNNVFNGGGGDLCQHTEPGTIEHAYAVAARIEKFIQKNIDKLKARRLPSLAKRRQLAKDWI